MNYKENILNLGIGCYASCLAVLVLVLAALIFSFYCSSRVKAEGQTTAAIQKRASTPQIPLPAQPPRLGPRHA